MKGALDKEFAVGLIIVFGVLVIALLFYFKFIKIGGLEIGNTQDLSAECARWVSTSPPCKETNPIETSLDSYPGLKAAYIATMPPPTDLRTALDMAKAFCSCPW
ncbi:MAG: hypothetical protein JW727_00670 [Candidatus Aenigmarchaeota archaeon]|nr:hypothetical protein [Candidatus Aenigmarchaeota archaeon]